MRRALILVDIQKDFCPGGALAVAGGNGIIDPANKLSCLIANEGGIIVATQDWHPTNHGSFGRVSEKALFSTFDLNGLQQTAWPDHCVQGS